MLGGRRWGVRNAETDVDAELPARIWAKDSSVWGPGEDDPAGRLGWLELPQTMLVHLPRLVTFTQGVIEDGIETVVLLGMGGSSLAPEMFARTYGSKEECPSLIVLDSTHPAQVRTVEETLDPERTLFLVSSKSGGTLETVSLYRHFRAKIDDGSRFVAITDAGTSLERLAIEEGFRAVFANPPDIGGRYSALSLFGLLPAALIGADVEGLLSSASEAARDCGPDQGPGANPGLDIGTVIGRLAWSGWDKLTFIISDPIASFGAWLEQLLAESTGKQGRGVVPIVGEPRPTDPALYREDRAFVHLRLAGDPADDDFVESLAAGRGHPVVVSDVPGVADLGYQIFVWEFATAVAGAVLSINAFDQPNVEAAKKAGREVLESNEEVRWPDDPPSALWESLQPGDLAVIAAFAPATPGHEETIAAARLRLVAEHGVATMGGFGPRYLHSTGQLHKGGRDNVHALVVLDPPEEDEPIPKAGYGFARLVWAQAQGDARALESAGRKVLRTTWQAFEKWARAAPTK